MRTRVPGGPAVERLARNGDPQRFAFPRPLLREARLDFSFSGLKTAVRLAAEPQLKPYVDIPRMAEMAVEMLRDALDCFLHADAKKAVSVVQRDAEVDAINKQLYRELTSYMIEKPDTISRALELMFISKSIERIADHATNIAEEMVFLFQARDIRHSEEAKKPSPTAS